MLGNQHTLILPYLENLCAHDETVVRERAVASITRLLDLTLTTKSTISSSLSYADTHLDHKTCLQWGQFHLQSLCYPPHVQRIPQSWPQQGKN
jgi:hypothetical protein